MRATILENITANDKTTPNSINNRPVLPSINERGKKTLTKTKVVAITTKVICFAPKIDASIGDSPLSSLRFIFSKTTIESSTIKLAQEMLKHLKNNQECILHTE